MTVGYFKEALYDFLPRQTEFLLYLYEKFGKILYDEQWEVKKEFNTYSKKYWKGLYAVLFVLERFSIEEQMEVIEFIFEFSYQNLVFEKKINKYYVLGLYL